MGVRVGVVTEGGAGAEGVGGAVHAACGAEGVGVAAGGAPGAAILKRHASSAAAQCKPYQPSPQVCYTHPNAESINFMSVSNMGIVVTACEGTAVIEPQEHLKNQHCIPQRPSMGRMAISTYERCDNLYPR